MKGEDHYRRMDGLSKDFELIYKFPLHYSINCGKFVAVGSLACFGAAKLFSSLYESDKTGFLAGIAISDLDYSLLVAGFLAMNIVLYRYCNIIPLRIYKNEKQ